ncbi:MAG: enoyl-CoA hydratase/isomerase family protein [Myxococcota bacterium]
MSSPHVLTRTTGPFATLTLNRPAKRNALSRALLAELIEAAGRLRERDDVHVVLFEAAGGSWSVGADLHDVAALLGEGPPTRAWARQGQDAVEALEALPQVVVAAARGHVLGGGLLLFLAADLRIAARGARFALPEVPLGIPLAWGGIPRLVREIGPATTRDLVLTGRTLEAEEARAMGLVSRVVGEGDLDAEAAATVRGLLDTPAHPLRQTKAQMREAVEALVDGSAAGDADRLLAAMAHPDFAAAARAFRK